MKLSIVVDHSPSGEHLPGISDESDSVSIGGACNVSDTVEAKEATASPTVVEANRPPFVPAVKQSKFVAVNLSDPEYATRYAQVVADAMTMTKGQLQVRYKQEYNCLRSRREQARSRHIKFFDNLKDIRDWLIHLGPIPAKYWTVDRIKNAKGYQPGNLRWATKIQQTQNRKVTKWHQMPDGTRLTTEQLAKRLGLKYNALFKRLKRGWTVERLLQQEQQLGLESWKFHPALAQHCEPLYRERKYHQQHRIDWFISYVNDVVYNKLKVKWHAPSNAVINLMQYFKQAENDREVILKRQKEREQQSLQELLIILDPPALTTSSQFQSIDTDKDRERFLNEYGPLL